MRIGTTTAQVYNPENRMKVPDVLFYDNAQVNTQSPEIHFTMYRKLIYFCGHLISQLDKKEFLWHFELAIEAVL